MSGLQGGLVLFCVLAGLVLVVAALAGRRGPALRVEGAHEQLNHFWLHFMAVKYPLTSTQQTTIRLSGYVDRHGNPAEPPAGATAPAWATDSPQLLRLTPAADGLSCLVAAAGPTGKGTVTAVTGLGDLAVVFVVVAGPAAAVTPSVDDPVEQP